MADSLLTSLLGMLDAHTVEGIAGSLGASGQSVSQGLKSSIAAVLGGMASKAEDPHALRTMLDLPSGVSEGTTFSQIAQAASDPNSPLMSAGKRLFSGLFGNSADAVTDAVSAGSGLRTGTASTLLSMAAPMVLGFISNRVRTEGMNMTGLGNLLQRESGAIRSALPSGLSDLFWPRQAATAAPYPAATLPVQRRPSSPSWLPVLAILALLGGLIWLFSQLRRPTPVRFGSTTMGTASRTYDLGNLIKQKLPNGIYVNIPERGVEARLLSFIQNSGNTISEKTWFDFDRLSFDTASGQLRPESQEQLNSIAAILKAYPNVHVKVGGYTDNVGDADSNLQLSRDRANTVVAELVRRGISPDRLEAEGYGERYPVGDNSTEEGRAQNRRVSMRVTQK